MQEFFSIDLSSIENAGLSHQTSNLKVLIMYSHMNNLKLIKPTFTLTGMHNNNNKIYSDLSEYYDLNNISLYNKPYMLYDKEYFNGFTIEKKQYKYGLLIMDKVFSNVLALKTPPFGYMNHEDGIDMPNSLNNINYGIKIPYNCDIIEIARLVTSLIGNDFMCIHVRRGDRVTTHQIDIDTRPDNILKKIEEQDIKNIYIMTNKIDEIIGLKENKDFNIFFYDDFDILRNIKDNYFLFCVENVIMRMARIRCSTFKVSSDYYNCNLTDKSGGQ